MAAVEHQPSKKPWWRRWRYVPLALASVWWLSPWPGPAFIESSFSRGWFRWVTSLTAPLHDLVPVSLSLILLIVALISLPWLWWRGLRRRLRARASVRSVLGWGLDRIATGIGIVALLFLLLWGAGYRRTRLETRLGIDGPPTSTASLGDLLRHTLTVIDETIDAPRDTDRALASIAAAMAQWTESIDSAPVSIPHQVKRLPAGSLLAFGVTGIMSPWLVEPHIDGALPPTARVATGAHELAHAAGYCGEADADVASFLAGMRAEDGFARYAIALRMYLGLVGELPPSQQLGAIQQLPIAALQDRALERKTIKAYRIDWLRRSSSLVYHGYLRAQGVEAGIADYGRGVLLLVRAYEEGALRFD